MAQILEGKLESNGKKFAIVAARFNDVVTTKLLEGAVAALKQNGVREEEVTVAWVPGAFEIPATAKKLAASKKYAAVICLGALIRGETPHFDYIAAAASKGIEEVGRECGVPVIFGVLTVDKIEQALERAGGKMGNKGTEAALAAIRMADLFEQIWDDDES